VVTAGPATAVKEQIMQQHITSGLWNYKPNVSPTDADVVGYEVEATDGKIGVIDAANRETDDSHFVVDTGFWIFGKKRLIPAGVVASIDHVQRRVTVRLSKDDIRDAPDWDDRWTEQEWHAHHERYYSSFGWMPGGVD
jgi:hypothetical protein